MRQGCSSDWPLPICSGHGTCTFTNDTSIISYVGPSQMYCKCDSGWSWQAGGEFVSSEWRDCGHNDDAVLAIRLLQTIVSAATLMFATYKLVKYCQSHHWQPRSISGEHHGHIQGAAAASHQHPQTWYTWLAAWARALTGTFPFRLRVTRMVSSASFMTSGILMLSGYRVMQNWGPSITVFLATTVFGSGLVDTSYQFAQLNTTMLYGNLSSEAPMKIIRSARRYAIFAPISFIVMYSTLFWGIIWKQHQEIFAIIFLSSLTTNALVNGLRFLYLSHQIMAALNDLDRVSPLKSDVKDVVMKRLQTMRKVIRFTPFVSALIPFLAAAWPLIRYRMSYALPLIATFTSLVDISLLVAQKDDHKPNNVAPVGVDAANGHHAGTGSGGPRIDIHAHHAHGHHASHSPGGGGIHSPSQPHGSLVAVQMAKQAHSRQTSHSHDGVHSNSGGVAVAAVTATNTGSNGGMLIDASHGGVPHAYATAASTVDNNTGSPTGSPLTEHRDIMALQSASAEHTTAGVRLHTIGSPSLPHVRLHPANSHASTTMVSGPRFQQFNQHNSGYSSNNGDTDTPGSPTPLITVAAAAAAASSSRHHHHAHQSGSPLQTHQQRVIPSSLHAFPPDSSNDNDGHQAPAKHANDSPDGPPHRTIAGGNHARDTPTPTSTIIAHSTPSPPAGRAPPHLPPLVDAPLLADRVRSTTTINNVITDDISNTNGNGSGATAHSGRAAW